MKKVIFPPKKSDLVTFAKDVNPCKFYVLFWKNDGELPYRYILESFSNNGGGICWRFINLDAETHHNGHWNSFAAAIDSVQQSCSDGNCELYEFDSIKDLVVFFTQATN